MFLKVNLCYGQSFCKLWFCNLSFKLFCWQLWAPGVTNEKFSQWAFQTDTNHQSEHTIHRANYTIRATGWRNHLHQKQTRTRGKSNWAIQCIFFKFPSLVNQWQITESMTLNEKLWSLIWVFLGIPVWNCIMGMLFTCLVQCFDIKHPSFLTWASNWLLCSLEVVWLIIAVGMTWTNEPVVIPLHVQWFLLFTINY